MKTESAGIVARLIKTAIKNVTEWVKGFVTGWGIFGVCTVATGFSPDDWMKKLPLQRFRVDYPSFDIRDYLVAFGIAVFLADVLWRRRSKSADSVVVLDPAKAKQALFDSLTAARKSGEELGTAKRRVQLRERLSKSCSQGAGIRAPADQESWLAAVAVVLDRYLGPSPINQHSPAYYDFRQAGSHQVRLGILRGVLESQEDEQGSVKMDAWAAEVLVLIDRYLGPSPINQHSPEYYQFKKAESHEQRIGVLRGVLASAELLSA